MSVWQCEERRCGAVLREVFAWLDARSLARAGAACRAWRRAAAAPAHWRRLLRRAAPLPHAAAAAAAGAVSWRAEYVRAHAGWREAARHGAAAELLHAALAPRARRLALCGADASLAVWARGAAGWRELARTSLRARGWRAVARAHWPASAARLLLAGPLALVDDWELIVLRVEEDGSCDSVTSRVRCSAGGAGCWADPTGNAFLSLELRRLGLGIYCTTVWLNSATQETQSEYAGVTSPLLRVYNEDGAHITHALVAHAPVEDCTPGDDEDETEIGPGLAYLRAIEPTDTLRPTSDFQRMLVMGGGCRIGAWAVSAPRPPALLATEGGGLRERVRRRRARVAAPDRDADAPEPDEATVRAVCTAPAHTCRLTAQLVGLVLHDRGRCLWAVCSDGGATCLSPALRVLARVPGAAAAPAAHYVQPAASDALLAWPAGAYSGRVRWCAARSGARGADLAHAGAAVCCVLPPVEPAELLVLAADQLHVWVSRATPQREPCDIE